MPYNVDLINGSHFEWNVFYYLLKNIFPEVDIDKRNPQYHGKINNPDFKLVISANLDTTLNGKHIGKYIYFAKRLPICDKKIFYLNDDISNEDKYIFWTGEPYDVTIDDESSTKKHKYLILSSLHKDENTINMPFASFSFIQFYVNNYLDKYRSDLSRYCTNLYLPMNRRINQSHNHDGKKNDPEKKKYFLAFCASHKIQKREDFMRLLISKYHNNKDIYCLGNHYIASDDQCSCKLIKRAGVPNCLLIDEYSKFKFVLTMENGFRKGYVTEKIVNAFIAGSIPIYWGDHEYAKQLFNPKSFICIQDYESFEDCIDYIINMSEEQINNMLKEPMFKDNIVPPEFDITNFSEGSFYGDLKKRVRDMCLSE